MVNLNFPEFDLALKKAEGKVWIFDVIRKKYVVVTPEEWVRQHLVHYFITHLKYPRSHIRVEIGLTYNELQKRADVLIYDREGLPWLVAECKSFKEKLTEATVRQVSTYNFSLGAKYVVVTNGLTHYCAAVDYASRQTSILKDFPAFG